MSGLSADEARELAGWLIAKYHLGIFECFPDSHLVACFERMSTLCQRVEQMICRLPEESSFPGTEKVSPVTGKAGKSKPDRPRRLSRNGKPLGRPRKVRPEEQAGETNTESASGVDNKVSETEVSGAENKVPEAEISAEENGKAEPGECLSDEENGEGTETVNGNDGRRSSRGRKKVYDIKEMLSLSPPKTSKPGGRMSLSRFFLQEEDFPLLRELRMGLPHRLRIVYKAEDKYVVSHYVLRDLMPVLVCVMYQRRIGIYSGVGIALEDDHSGISAVEAADYAATLPAIDGEPWRVMNSLQYAQLRSVSADLNLIIKKLGGDVLNGHYVTLSFDGSYPCGQGKIRYAVNLK